jgi:oligoendopeptidase F
MYRLIVIALFCCTPVFALEEIEPSASMPRGEIPPQYLWDLSALFPADAAWEEAMMRVETDLHKLKAFEGRLEDGKALAECLKIYFDLHVRANRVTLYANLKHASDMVDPANKAAVERSLKTMDELMNAARFIRSGIMGLDEASIGRTGLAPYKPYIEDLRRRRGILLSEEGERILSLAGDNLFAEIDLNEIPSSLEKVFNGLMSDMALPMIRDEEGKEIQLALSNYGRYRGSSNREVRRGAVEAFFAALKRHQHVLAATYGGQVAFNSFLARARGYGSAREAYLDKDDIRLEVYDNLVNTINANLKPLHRYMALRKRVMGVDAIGLYDLYVPMVPGADRDLPYEEAKRLIRAALEPLGEDYLEVLDQGFDPANGWVDVYPCQDKESGAFSASTYDVHPYVKMNYFNKIDDVSTLAHEFGHALHSYLSMQNQPPASFRYVSFIAEIASTFNESLLSKHLIANAPSREEKLALLNERAESIRTTIYRQTLFAEFERAVHAHYEAGGTLTAQWLNRTYGDLIRRYYGEAYTVGPDDDIEWAYIPHFYWKFYVFTYATGLSAGIALADKVAAAEEGARDQYLEMLKSGCSKPPLVLLERAGLDLTKPDAIEAAARLLDSTLDEMESLLQAK